MKLAKLIDWHRLEVEFKQHYGDKGAGIKPIRLLAGLEYLKQIHKLPDENTVAMWCKNQYWQYFFACNFSPMNRLAAKVQ
ncbi:hypothetical protein [Pseudoalteromonas maricaloris]|uniref:hypothetical protein n=1 Tax=Pseudoalteromonas maricaloris TaxID=184924 RepID=UPI003C1313C2